MSILPSRLTSAMVAPSERNLGSMTVFFQETGELGVSAFTGATGRMTLAQTKISAIARMGQPRWLRRQIARFPRRTWCRRLGLAFNYATCRTPTQEPATIPQTLRPSLTGADFVQGATGPLLLLQNDNTINKC